MTNSISGCLSATASAQFSASGAGSAIPASGTGGGGTFPLVLPVTPATSAAAVGVAVTSIDSVVIDGLTHTWAGDVQATLSDPNGVEHLLFLRPGFLNTSNFGTAGDFLAGTYTFVESGGASLPTSSNGIDITPGTYDQTFDSGGVIWNSGDAGIVNTPMSMITGPAGNWTLTIYDWGGGDSGSFTGWTLNGQGGATGPNTGAAYCFGDGTGAACPCSANGAAGEGCMTTSGSGALLVGSGDADVANDSLSLSVTGGPAGKPGIFFQGDTQMAAPAGDGLLCSNSTLRYAVNYLDASGSVTQSGFGANATSGTTLNYQYWFRDPANTCGMGGFNYSNGWVVTWN